MKPHHFIFRGLVMALFLAIATPVNAQTSEEWAAYNPRVARVRAELKELQKTGPIRNWNLRCYPHLVSGRIP